MSGSVSRHEVTIGENKFFIRRFNAFLAIEILGDLQKQFAGPLLSMLDGKGGGTAEENQATMMAAFGKLSATIDGKTLRQLAERLLDKEYISVQIAGTEPRKLDASAVALSLETAADILQLCWAVVQWNFSEVLSRLSSPTGPAAPFLKARSSEDSTRSLRAN